MFVTAFIINFPLAKHPRNTFDVMAIDVLFGHLESTFYQKY